MENEDPEASTQLLKQMYDLHKAPEVEAAANRHTARTGEPVSQNPHDRIQNYLNRFHEITDRGDPEDREHGMNAIKRLLYEKYVVKPDQIPESYWENQRRIIRERGQGADLEQVDFEELKRQNTEAIIAGQASSLDTWVDYLSSPDALHPDSIKYFALRSVLELGKYDKEKKEFPKRFTGMTQPFSELDREALAYVADGLVKKYTPEYFELGEKIDALETQVKAVESYNQKASLLSQIPEEDMRVHTIDWNGKKIHVKGKDVARLRESLQTPTNTNLEKLMSTSKDLKQERIDLLQSRNLPEEFLNLPEDENFSKMYAYAIEQVTPASQEQLAITEGQWVKYDQGSDHMSLVASLQGHGTGWCTAGVSTAQAQLKGGDFYVYYSHDKDGKPTVPRVAIRMEESNIAEVRGIAPEQNLDSYVAPIVEQKLEEFPDGKAYQKKVVDMKRLTQIDHKTQKAEPLDAADLTFLYEVDSPIQGFGYSRDPRIEEIRVQRNPEEDMPVVFGCEPSQIAHTPSEIRPDTKAYVGPLALGVFDRLQEHQIEHVYTSFPEGKIRRQEVEIGGKTKEQLQQELEQAGVEVTSYAQDMMRSPDFTTLPVAQMLPTVRLKVGDLGFSNYATTDQLYKKAQELGLDLCPAEVGPRMRLAEINQPIGDYYWIGMKQITDSGGYPHVFSLVRGEDGLWLRGPWATPDDKWYPDREFVFSLRKKA